MGYLWNEVKSPRIRRGERRREKKNPHMGNNDKKHESVESGDFAHENELLGTFKDYVHVLS